MKTIIAGSRSIPPIEFLYAMEHCPFLSEITHVISGKAKGIDTYGEKFAQINGLPILEYPANWSKYGKYAGFIRNKEMVKIADCLIAIWDGKSNGTRHTIKLAMDKRIKIFLFRTDNRKYKVINSAKLI